MEVPKEHSERTHPRELFGATGVRSIRDGRIKSADNDCAIIENVQKKYRESARFKAMRVVRRLRTLAQAALRSVFWPSLKVDPCNAYAANESEPVITTSIDSIPRVNLATLPTPLQEARALREALGGTAVSPKILLKRDDLTGLAFGGNKARKLEFLVADALYSGATTLITSGAVQSNHASMTAAAARMAGLKVALVLSRPKHARESKSIQGNLLLDRVLGATIYFVEEFDGMDVAPLQDAMAEEIAAMLAREGERPYIIPVGGSNAIGTLGYVDATRELLTQLDQLDERPRYVYFASGSRSTQAGLLLGAKLYQAPYELRPIAVSKSGPEKIERTRRLVNEAATLIGASVQVEPEELVNDHEFVGAEYGDVTNECLAAIRLMARCEGVFVDPVYTGKALAGMVEHIRRGYFRSDESIVFLHTGGSPSLFAHGDYLE